MGTSLHEEPLRPALEHDGRGPSEVVQLEPRLHPSHRRAPFVDVHGELQDERGHTGADPDLEPHGHREGEVRPEALRQLRGSRAREMVLDRFDSEGTWRPPSAYAPKT